MLGTEVQLPASGVIDERLLAQAVASEHEGPSPRVPDGNGEHPVEALDERGTVPLVEVDDDLGVRLRPERMPRPRQLIAQLFEVVDLAVEHGPDAPALVALGLVTGDKVDDPQPPDPERGVRIAVLAGGVRTAVHDGLTHRSHFGCPIPLRNTNDAGDTAHLR